MKFSPSARPSLAAFSLSLSLAAAAAMPALAGVHLVSVHESLTEKKDPMTINIWLDKDRVRVEGMGQGYMIFRGDKQLFWMVNEQDKSYTEMTKADAERVGAKMDDAMKQLKEQMEKMPPEQRAMMEKMMKGMTGGMAGGEPPKMTYKKLGSDKVGSWSCDKYENLADGVKKSESCLADPKKLDISEADMAVFKDMAGFFAKMIKNMESFMPALGNKEAPQGLPVRTVAFNEGKATSKTELKEAKKESVDAARFDLPKGLTKKNLGGGPRGEHGF